jgi:hypothetical protein
LKKPVVEESVSGEGGNSDAEGSRVLGKRLHNNIGKKVMHEGVSSFPPIKRKRGRPAKNDQARMQA